MLFQLITNRATFAVHLTFHCIHDIFTAFSLPIVVASHAQVPIDLSVTSPILIDGNWRTTRGLANAIRRAEAEAADALFGNASLSSPPSLSSSLSSASSAPAVVALGVWGEARLTHVREESLIETPTVRRHALCFFLSFALYLVLPIFSLQFEFHK